MNEIEQLRILCQKWTGGAGLDDFERQQAVDLAAHLLERLDTTTAALKDLHRYCSPIVLAIMDADACGKSSVKLSAVIEDAVHAGLALDVSGDAIRASRVTP